MGNQEEKGEFFVQNTAKEAIKVSWFRKELKRAAVFPDACASHAAQHQSCPAERCSSPVWAQPWAQCVPHHILQVKPALVVAQPALAAMWCWGCVECLQQHTEPNGPVRTPCSPCPAVAFMMLRRSTVSSPPWEAAPLPTILLAV